MHRIPCCAVHCLDVVDLILDHGVLEHIVLLRGNLSCLVPWRWRDWMQHSRTLWNTIRVRHFRVLFFSILRVKIESCPLNRQRCRSGMKYVHVVFGCVLIHDRLMSYLLIVYLVISADPKCFILAWIIMKQVKKHLVCIVHKHHQRTSAHRVRPHLLYNFAARWATYKATPTLRMEWLRAYLRNMLKIASNMLKTYTRKYSLLQNRLHWVTASVFPV